MPIPPPPTPPSSTKVVPRPLLFPVQTHSIVEIVYWGGEIRVCGILFDSGQGQRFVTLAPLATAHSPAANPSACGGHREKSGVTPLKVVVDEEQWTSGTRLICAGEQSCVARH